MGNGLFFIEWEWRLNTSHSAEILEHEFLIIRQSRTRIFMRGAKGKVTFDLFHFSQGISIHLNTMRTVSRSLEEFIHELIDIRCLIGGFHRVSGGRKNEHFLRFAFSASNGEALTHHIVRKKNNSTNEPQIYRCYFLAHFSLSSCNSFIRVTTCVNVVLLHISLLLFGTLFLFVRGR